MSSHAQPLATILVDKMEIYVDGSYRASSTHSPIAVAAAVFKHECGTHNAYTRLLAPEPVPTQHRADLMAIVLALERALGDDGRLYKKRAVEITIYSSSVLAVKCMTDWSDRWIENAWVDDDGADVENRDLIRRALEVEDLLTSAGSVRYTCIPREENTLANLYCAHVLDHWMAGSPMAWEWEFSGGAAIMESL